MQISDKYGLVYVITKLGLLFVYDLETATAVYRNRISPDPIFLTAPAPGIGGFYAINRCNCGFTPLASPCAVKLLCSSHTAAWTFCKVRTAHSVATAGGASSVYSMPSSQSSGLCTNCNMHSNLE